MLTDGEIEVLAKKMSVPLVFCDFKDQLPNKIQTNKAYIINMDDTVDTEGNSNSGTHWTAFYINQYPNGKKEGIYFDSYGQPPPEIVKKRVASNFGINNLSYSTKDIQSLMNNACGYYCLAFLHFVSASQYRSRNLYDDVGQFLSMFDDLNEQVDYKKNEYILKHFFVSKDPSLRKPIDVGGGGEIDTDEITDGNEDEIKVPVNVNVLNKHL